MLKRCLILFVSITLTATIVMGSPSPVGAGTVDDEAQFVVLINDLRASLGLLPLTPDGELASTSAAWTEVLVNNGELSHAPDLSDGITASWAKLGENVGVATAGQTQQLFDAFVASPSHYENLVDPDFTYIGVSVAYDDSGRMWTTHRFMKVFDEMATTTTTTSPPASSTIASPTSTAPTTTTTTTTVQSQTTGPTTTALPEAPISNRPLDRDYVVIILDELAMAGI